jgi:UDP-glucuronate decarboxylase
LPHKYRENIIMKRILVSGGAGFIGSHLCTRLLQDGHYVVCLDNFFTGSRKNIAHLKSNRLFEFVHHDIEQPYFRDGIDEIYNLACPASPIHYQFDAIKTVKTSTIGVLNMLGLAKRSGAKILQASTSEVYGDPTVHPQVESYWGNVNPIGFRSCYDEGKRCAETLFMDYHRQNHLRIKIVRIFNTYGPRMLPDDGRVVSNFVVQALQNKDITIYGTGRQTRSFQYVDDLVEGLVRMMNTDDDFIGPVNIGNPNEFSILELAQKIIDKTGSQSRIIFEPLPHDDPKQRQPDIALAMDKLQWRPTIELDEGLDRIIEYFKGEKYSN